MTVRHIVYLPNAVLRQVAKPVEQFDDTLQVLIDDMFETMHHVRGVGLAAPQVGVSLRLAVLDTSDDKTKPLVLINPEIIKIEGQKEYTEGCLSVPGVFETVFRPEKVYLRAMDRYGNDFELTADGLLGQCLQHEIDHLNGKLFVDLLSPMKRHMLRRKMEKFQRQQQKQ